MDAIVCTGEHDVLLEFLGLFSVFGGRYLAVEFGRSRFQRKTGDTFLVIDGPSRVLIIYDSLQNSLSVFDIANQIVFQPDHFIIDIHDQPKKFIIPRVEISVELI